MMADPSAVSRLLLVAERFLGLDMQYRRGGWRPGWWPPSEDAPWRVRLVTSKNENSDYRIDRFGISLDEACQRVLDEVDRLDAGREDGF